jgi:hypothetical protein
MRFARASASPHSTRERSRPVRRFTLSEVRAEMAAKVGDVFDYPGTESGESPYRNRGGWHIHIVVKVDESRGDAYLIPLSTVLYRDGTCEIDVKDGCPSVTERCVVAYIHGKKIPLDGLQKLGRFRGPAPKELLARVLAGIQTSLHSPQWFKDAVFPPAPRAGRILPVNT